MRVLFLNPPFMGGAYSRTSRSPAITKSGTVYYPFWLAYSAGLTESDDRFEVKLVDAAAEGWSQDDVLKLAREFRPRLVVIDTSTASIYADTEIGTQIKQALGDCFVVLTGTHVTAVPEETLAGAPAIDAVAKGEHDATLLELARVLEAGGDPATLTGLVVRDADFIRVNPDRALIKDLDALPLVSATYKKHLDVYKYFFSAAQYPMVMIITSRGCPYKCAWCVYPQTLHREKFRARSAENVVAEFDYIHSALPLVNEIGIEDDLFVADRRRLRRICELLIDRPYRINWWCDTRTDLSYEDMRLMKEAGCRLLIAGFESASQETLDAIRKGTQADDAFTFCESADKAGLLIHGCFVFGQIGENRESMRKTLDLALQLPIDNAQFFPMMVYPGTTAYEWARTNGYLKTTDYRQWLTPDGLHNSVVDTPDLKSDEVVAFCNQARKEFYLRPRYVLKKALQSLTDLQEARRNLKGARKLVAHMAKAVF